MPDLRLDLEGDRHPCHELRDQVRDEFVCDPRRIATDPRRIQPDLAVEAPKRCVAIRRLPTFPAGWFIHPRIAQTPVAFSSGER